MAHSSVTNILSDFVARAQGLPLPTAVVLQAKHHILDTFAAIITGATLQPGQIIIRYVGGEGGTPEAQVAGSSILTNAGLAALANGTSAHADETDDSHAASGTHPGCAVIPAALAMAEREGAGGEAFMKAVVAGYDIGCRVGRALQPNAVSAKGHSSRSLGNVFGAAAAAASVALLDGTGVRCALSYAAQQAAGIGSYIRAHDHVEKAFVLGGMPARNGVTAVRLAQAGASGAADPFTGERNFLQAYSPDPQLEELVRGLGTDFEITQTSIKRYCVGSPIQAPLEALFEIMSGHQIGAENVARVTAHLPARRAATVDNREMADVNLQYILALALLRGKVTFAAAHARNTTEDASVQSLQSRIELVADPSLLEEDSPRQVRLEVLTRDGKKFTKHLRTYRGTPDNPASPAELEEKARDLLSPVIGEEKTARLIQQIQGLERIKDMRELRPILAAA
jgi:2-methylcitrate dehydratase PrpD